MIKYAVRKASDFSSKIVLLLIGMYLVAKAFLVSRFTWYDICMANAVYYLYKDEWMLIIAGAKIYSSYGYAYLPEVRDFILTDIRFFVEELIDKVKEIIYVIKK